MLDIKYIRENKQEVEEGIRKKGSKVDIEKVLEIDKTRRSKQQELDTIKAAKNKLGKEINELSPKERDARIAALRNEDVKADSLEKELKEAEEKLEDLLSKIPNLPDNDVPVGKNEADNVVIKTVGKKPNFNFEPSDYLTLAQEMDIVDMERAAKISGSRFGYLKGAAAMLEFAIVQFTMKSLTDPKIISKIAKSVDKELNTDIFIPVVPPVMIREEPYYRMGRLDLDQKEERYYIPEDDLYLVGSAEHSLGPMYMDEILSEDELPKRFLGFSTAFRREAGSYGKDTKGILRVHQFDKLEMESFVKPENSHQEFEFIVACQEYLMSALELPYQLMFISTGDMGSPDARQYDINTWMPGENKYRETHTADLMTDYQARRLNTRFRRKDGQVELLHMIDATAFAIGRILIAIIENYQQTDGSIKVPKVLQPYMPVKEIKGPYGLSKK